MSTRIVIKNILLLSLISLIIRSFGVIAANFSKYIYDPAVYMQTNVMYILFYIVLLIGWKPGRFLNIGKIIYKLSGLATRYVNEKDDFILYITVFDSVILSILGTIILKTQKLTANTMKLLAGITGLRFICKFVWGYKTARKVVLSEVSMVEQEKNIKATDLLIEKMANADYNKLYENADNMADSYKVYSTLKTDKERQNFILLKLLELESNKTLDHNTSKYMNDLTDKIKELNDLKKSSENLLSCMKTSIPQVENSLNKIN